MAVGSELRCAAGRLLAAELEGLEQSEFEQGAAGDPIRSGPTAAGLGGGGAGPQSGNLEDLVRPAHDRHELGAVHQLGELELEDISGSWALHQVVVD